MAMTRDERIEYLKANLKKKRFLHSLAVEQEARKLALRFGEDAELAARAGLIHDCAKNLPMEAQLAALRAAGYPPDEFLTPPLYHGPAGAFIARTRLGEQDPRVLDAIAHHTVPALYPTGLAAIVLIADMIEPGRDFPGIDGLREACRRDLNQALARALSVTVAYELSRGNPVHPNSLIVFNRLAVLQRGPADATMKKKEAST
jgi:predicted HD superfamily hydrolase involved in NAD metabolism